MIMAQDHLQGPGGDAFLDTGNGKGVAQHMRRYRPSDAGPVSHPLYDPLNGSDAKAEAIIKTKMIFDERLDSV